MEQGAVGIIAIRLDDIYPTQLRCELRGRKVLRLHPLVGDVEYRVVTIVLDSDRDIGRYWDGHYVDNDQSRLSMVGGGALVCSFPPIARGNPYCGRSGTEGADSHQRIDY